MSGGSDPRSGFPLDAVEQAVGSEPVEWNLVESGGYGRVSAHWRVALADGRRAFVKQALTDDAVAWLRKERLVYESVTGAFMPSYLGAHDDGVAVLVLEDLTGAEWPPPWTARRIEAVLAALDEVHATQPPTGIGRLESERNPFDVAFWLPSLRLEGGPEPWEVLPQAGALAAAVAGFFASRAGLAPPPGAPTVREFQRAQAEVALRWTVRELGLPSPSRHPN